MKAQNTNVKVLIGNATSAPAESTLSTFKATGSAGEVQCFEQDGTAFAAGSKGLIIAVRNSDGSLNTSEVIPVAGIVSASAKAYVAGTNQVDYIGFNGTSGSIDTLNLNHYLLNIRINEHGSRSIENYETLSAEYYSDASASQKEVADGIVASIVATQADWDQEFLKVERVINNAGTALGTGVDALQFTKGSKYFTATDIDDATTNAALAVGDYIRIGTGVTDPVYRVTAINTSTNVGTLDIPFQGTTTSGLVDTGAERIPAATAATADFGVKITAQSLTAVPGKFDVERIRFRTDLQNFGSTTLTRESTAATIGLGSGAQVREHEWFARGNFGEMYRTGQPSLFDNDLVALSSNNYDTLTINYYLDERERLTYVSSPRSIVVYFNTGSGTDDPIDGVVDQLNASTVSSALAGLAVLSA